MNTRIKIFKKLKNKKFTDIEKESILGQGWQGIVYKYNDKSTSFKLAVKKIYLNNTQSKYINDIYNKKALKYGVYIELISNQLINNILLKKVSQNFIFNYSNTYIERYGICNESFPYKSLYFNELIENVVEYKIWVKKHHGLHVWFNAYFQIIYNLYVLQKHLNITHLDLHAGNILVQKVEKGGYWQYIVNKKKYNVPNLGYIFYINDFGQAYIPKTRKINNKKINNSYDLRMLFKSTFKYSTSSNEFKKTIKYIIKTLKTRDFEEIIYEIWGNMYTKANLKTTPIDIFNINKTINIPKRLKEIINS